MAGNYSTVTWPNYSTANVKAAARNTSKELGKDDFLKILITQLQNQDPSEPMQDKDFIAQMAQFSALEQTTNMATQLQSLRYSPGMVSSVLGMNVQWLGTDSQGNAVTKSGIVTSVVTRDGVPYAKVGTEEIGLDKLTSISLPDELSGSGANAGG